MDVEQVEPFAINTPRCADAEIVQLACLVGCVPALNDYAKVLRLLFR